MTKRDRIAIFIGIAWFLGVLIDNHFRCSSDILIDATPLFIAILIYWGYKFIKGKN